MKGKIKWQEAHGIAVDLTAKLADYCQRIEIAGSVRRQRPEVGDIEIVAIPHMAVDMFNQPTENSYLDLIDWERYFGKVIKGGHKYKQIELPSGINLDLFIVTPPAQWGVQFLIRTGPADFSHRFVTHRAQGGMLPGYLRVQDGALWSNNHIIVTPEETDVFNLLGIPYIEPKDRQ